jgi:DNA gyrase subunit A
MADETPPTPPSPPGNPATPVNIEDELRTSYLDYAMSVIVGRAIPDVRDGLKPVHRRILYAMFREGLTHGSRYTKCAGIVGEVLKKYHPHGDSAVYDALVRLAQDWNLRYLLVDGQGNFGSVDGDPPAAYRYTEARMTALAEEMLADIDKDTVDFVSNYDDSTTEPAVLPTRFPNLLVNGSAGIAVGMATNIPPHNLREVITATVRLIRDPALTSDELMESVHGPDFPTGGLILGRSGIVSAYRTGRGTIQVRGVATIEPHGKEREAIVITEIPYQVNKARLLEHIAELMREKRIEGISEARDESDRDGMRVVVELKRDANSQVILNQLYELTALQTSFGTINLSIVGNRPQVLGLKETLQYFVDHRREVVTRRCRFELAEAEAAREIVEGLGLAVTEVDAVVQTIRASKDPDTAKKRLMELPLKGLEDFVKRAGRPESEIEEAKKRKDYRLSERQAKAILDMRLARLTGLEHEKLATEYGEICETIARLLALLGSDQLLMDLVVQELEDVAKKYGDDRRTKILDEEGDIAIEDLIAEEDMVVTCSHLGYIKRSPLSIYRAQRRGGRGKRGAETRTEDFVRWLFVASTHDSVLFFTDRGKVYAKKVYEIPEAGRTARGRAIVSFVGMKDDEKVAAIMPVSEFKEGTYVMTATRGGYVKKTDLMEYADVRPSGIIAVKIDEGDMLLAAEITDGKREMLIGTREGQSIRFPEEQVRPMGRSTRGVRGIELREGDAVVSMTTLEEGLTHVLTVCENGYGKRSEIEEYRQQNRGGIGIITIQASERNGPCVAVRLVGDDDHLMLVTDRGQVIRTKVKEISVIGRNTQGVRIMEMEPGERVVAVEPIAEEEPEDEAEAPPPAAAPAEPNE